jgi:hypothetical protein
MREVTLVFPTNKLMSEFIANESLINITTCATNITLAGMLTYEQIGKAHFNYEAKLKHFTTGSNRNN